MQEEGDPAYSYRGPSGALKVIRGRGCEESFRAAVVDPNHRSEISAKKHWLLDGPMDNEREIDGFVNVRGAPRQSSLNAALDNKNKVGKKKPGLFKGIGMMFRFGKHRKMDFPATDHHYHHAINEFDAHAEQFENHSTQNQENQHGHHPENQSNSQERPEENHQQQTSQTSHLHQQQQQHPQHPVQREPLYQRHGFIHRHAEQVQVI